MKDFNSQKFIGQNNAPRVHIEYDVEVYGLQKKVELPFVAGVFADLSGRDVEHLAPVNERSFLEFDTDNFDARLRTIQPRLRTNVRNTLNDDGTLLDIDLTFESMQDFEPAAIARRIPQMAKLLEARQRLAELITYMDGKTSAEEVIKQLMVNPERLIQLAANTEAQSSGSTD